MPPELAGLRLDAGAAKLFDRHSRSQLQRWIAEGHVRVNSRVTQQARATLRAGDELRLRVPAPAPTTVTAQQLKLDVVHEDDAVVVLDKPAGLTVHPGAGRPDGTLQNALLHRWPQTRTLPRSGIVHRLDKDTSGLLVVALTERAHAKLTEHMAERRIRREYDAVVIGVLPSGGTVRANMARHPRDRVKMAVVPNGRPAVTHYRVLERFAQHTHLRVKLETGRTHQIRVHLSHIRHPVVGDPIYGGRVVRGAGLPEELRRLLAIFPRQALHARELGFEHPVTGAHLSFVREPPADLAELIATLRRLARP
ncbi:MAG TPA: 23S rRNA pseudouridine(1911/1915/1917) synthase RluD [Verrucomicrobiae bacterium]|nr:23S rRNA pseudouridine(1911/1915/1917) synthase RluD [Verrucomicrobiae bacterium]